MKDRRKTRMSLIGSRASTPSRPRGHRRVTYRTRYKNSQSLLPMNLFIGNDTTPKDPYREGGGQRGRYMKRNESLDLRARVLPPNVPSLYTPHRSTNTNKLVVELESPRIARYPTSTTTRECTRGCPYHRHWVDQRK